VEAERVASGREGRTWRAVKRARYRFPTEMAIGSRLSRALEGLGAPVDYSRRTAYRRPPFLYRHLQWLGVLLAARGWVPAYVVMLEVRGRRTGRIRRALLVRTVHEGRAYLVALAGESQWVRNVRAAGGRALIRRGRPQRVLLVELQPEQRPAIIRAYLRDRDGRIGSRAEEARSYFGLSADPSLEEIRPIAGHYPVFEIVEGGRAVDRPMA